MGIDSVLDLREPDGHDISMIAEANLQYFHHPMREYDPPTLEQLEEGVRWSLSEIAEGRTVLIHCRVGISRSTCMACAVLIGQGHRLGSAISTVRATRPNMTLTEDQLGHLEALELRVRGE
jgi:protein-tyrosine phosphatase